MSRLRFLAILLPQPRIRPITVCRQCCKLRNRSNASRQLENGRNPSRTAQWEISGSLVSRSNCRRRHSLTKPRPPHRIIALAPTPPPTLPCHSAGRSLPAR
ncbi:hypothetical protein IWZ03DRAFT_386824 [Phyllosticta citriasiana]|uniref:Secreted protein n=1 Tax=Phyllosticta citriasiana TaxID=595635 RepID=A0ABR1KF30_9PEZI